MYVVHYIILFVSHDYRRPITSVADSVKKFGGAAPAGGSADVKKPHTVVTTKAKHSSPSHAKHEEKPPPGRGWGVWGIGREGEGEGEGGRGSRQRERLGEKVK